jgi:hypothetical protein
MTEANPEPEGGPAEPSPLPRWIPVAIGVALVAMGALAIYTGLHYRDDATITDHVRPRDQRRAGPAPPGEPGAGASLVLPGESGENRPVAGKPVTGQARVVISGDPTGVQGTPRLWARRGMVLDVLPEDAMVYVNDLPIGQVRQFNTPDEVYDFAEPGSYRVRIVSSEGAERTFIVTAADDAQDDIARVSARF